MSRRGRRLQRVLPDSLWARLEDPAVAQALLDERAAHYMGPGAGAPLPRGEKGPRVSRQHALAGFELLVRDVEELTKVEGLPGMIGYRKELA